MRIEAPSGLIGVDALDLDELEWDDDERFGGSLKRQNFQKYDDSQNRCNTYPAAQPVMMESCWVIFFSPASSRKVLPQKSFAALSRRQSKCTPADERPYNLVARLGASSNRGGTRPECQST